MRTFLLFVFFTGVILVVLNEVVKRPEQKVEYKYLEKDLNSLDDL
jgi:hypothetical protein